MMMIGAEEPRRDVVGDIIRPGMPVMRIMVRNVRRAAGCAAVPPGGPDGGGQNSSGGKALHSTGP